MLKYSVKQNVETSFKKCSNKESDAWNFILTSKYILHTDSRWYRWDFHVVTIWHLAFVPPNHEGIYPGVWKIGFKCLLSGSDRLLQARVCFKLIASQEFLKGSKKDGNNSARNRDCTKCGPYPPSCSTLVSHKSGYHYEDQWILSL